MNSIKTYLIGRAESPIAWIGFIGFFLEILLHLGHVSTLMLVFFVMLIITPEDRVTALFAEWTRKIKDADSNEGA